MESMDKHKIDFTFLASYCAIGEGEALARVEAVKSNVESQGHHVYKCIERGMFASARIHQHPDYSLITRRFVEDDFKLLELGCCFGTDARKMLFDGLQQHKLTVSDLHDFYWNVGEQILFRDDLKSVESVFVDFSVPWKDLEPETQERFTARFDVITAMAILHVLAAEQCLTFLQNAYLCLKPKNNSTLLGYCAGSTQPTDWGATPTKGLQGRTEAPRFLHSKESLEALLLSVGFIDIVVSHAPQKALESQVMREVMKGGGIEMILLNFTARK
jgi:hypothetical protein